ncbi:MAG TPA: hypothetical protein VJP80_08700 [Candidatus Saccharimonadales bacterium]|nr:hypothetical protein [Candidatus Saccharimonadales bacterium]
MPVFDTTSVVGGFNQIISDWAWGDDRQFSGDVQLSPNPPPPGDLSIVAAYFTLKQAPNPSIPDADSLIQSDITQTLTSFGQITAGAGGALSNLLIKVSSGQYEGINSITVGPVYFWDIRCITTGNVTFTAASGVVTFVPNVTQTNAAGTPAAFPNNGQPRFRGFTSQNPQTAALPGVYNAGDFFFNSNPINNLGSGWQCTIGGSPGTWVTFFGGGPSGGAIFSTVKTIAVGPYNVGAGDYAIMVNAAAGAISVNLPAATGSGRTLVIKKLDATGNAVNVVPAGVNTIDGVAGTYANTTPNVSNTLIDYAVGAWANI